jgi:hypothetical protein
MNKSARNHEKLNKPITESQMLLDTTFIRYIKEPNKSKIA